MSKNRPCKQEAPFINGISKPSPDGKDIGAAYIYLQSAAARYNTILESLSKLETNSYRETTQETGSDKGDLDIKMTQYWTRWRLDLQSRWIDDRSSGFSLGIDPFTSKQSELPFRGITISPDLGVFAAWIGRRLWFCNTKTEAILDRVASPAQTISEDGLYCLAVRFGPDSAFAIAAWGTQLDQGTQLRLYQIQKSVTTLGVMEICCEPKAFCFHPQGRLIAITSKTTGLYIFCAQDGVAPLLLRHFSSSDAVNLLKVSKTTFDRASPPSTDVTIHVKSDPGKLYA